MPATTSVSTPTTLWAEQTCGDDLSTAAFAIVARFGGLDGVTMDNVDPSSTVAADNEYQHAGRVDTPAGDVTGADFGFSFNAVVNIEDVNQGSLRRFMDNANAIAGANTMRFMPTVPTHTAGGGGNSCSAIFEGLLPTLDDSGTAFDSSDGITVRNDSATSTGTGGAAGIDVLPLLTLDLQLQLVAVDSGNKIGLSLQANDLTLRGIAIYGFGKKENDDQQASIVVGDFAGTLIERNVIGATAGSFTDPASGSRADNIGIDAGNGRAANIPLDISADATCAILFSVMMQ